MRKPEFTAVNEDFRSKRNAKFTLLGHSLSFYLIPETGTYSPSMNILPSTTFRLPDMKAPFACGSATAFMIL